MGKAVEVRFQFQLALLEARQVAVASGPLAARGEYTPTELLAAFVKGLIAAEEQLGWVVVVRALVLVGAKSILCERHILLEEIRGERIETAGGNDVARVVDAGERVADNAAKFRKIATQLLFGGNKDGGSGAERLLLLLEIHKPERAIATVIELRYVNGAAAGEPVLITFPLDLLGQEEIAGVQFIVAEKFVEAAVKRVRSTLGRHLNDARSIAIAGGRNACLDSELLHGVGAGAGQHLLECVIHI